jgi:hypothetical protein
MRARKLTVGGETWPDDLGEPLDQIEIPQCSGLPAPCVCYRLSGTTE